MEKNTANSWLCRNCNTEVAHDQATCPKCGAERPEEIECDTEEQVVIIESKEENIVSQKKRYIFRESVLVNAADILLILGIFLSAGALLSPAFLSDTIQNITTLSIVVAIVTFLFSLITWALFRTVAEISRMLREREKKE